MRRVNSYEIGYQFIGSEVKNSKIQVLPESYDELQEYIFEDGSYTSYLRRYR